MISLVEDRVEGVGQICRRYGVERLDLFGSAAGEGFDHGDSDLDFVVSFERRAPLSSSRATSAPRRTSKNISIGESTACLTIV